MPGSQADENVTGYATIWRDFLAKTKESIVLSFDGNFTSYEEDVRKVDAQRQMPGWNFCTFFIQKVSTTIFRNSQGSAVNLPNVYRKDSHIRLKL